MKKYYLKNISCAAFEKAIEDKLILMKEVKNVARDQKTQLLSFYSDNIREVEDVIRKIEPSLKIVEAETEGLSGSGGGSIKKELIRIIVVFILLFLGIFFDKTLRNTPFSIGEFLVFLSAYLLGGWGVLSKAARNIIHGKIFDENFLMSVATIGAFLIHEYSEAVAVMLFYIIGEFLQGIEVKRSRRSIRSLLEIRPDYANLKYKDDIKVVKPAEVKVGDNIIIKPGEKIPLDGEIIEGNSFVDTFTLTGEAVPRSVKVNDKVLAGMINKSGLLTVKVTKLFGESSISKILELVENASKKKAKTENFISTFARYYTPIVVGIALLVALLPPLLFSDQNQSDWVYRALVILVVSCPCALVVSIPLGYFGGIGGASRKGILIKGSNYLDALTEVKTVVFDKTGTLTRGVFKVTEIVCKNGFNKDEILYYAALAESHSNHPLAEAIIAAYGGIIDKSLILQIEEVAGKGIKADLGNLSILVGNDRLLHIENIDHDLCDIEGTAVHLVINRKYAGYIIISDEIKEDSQKAVVDLKNLGIKNIIMLTGDNKHSAEIIAREMGIKQFYYGLLPEDKVKYIEEIIRSSKGDGKVAFVGDGINDAPVITRADVGIAMGGLGSDAAVEAADIVIMEDHPSLIPEAIKISRRTREIVWQNIVFALVIKGLFIIMGGWGIATMWEAVFADMGVALIAVLNAARVMKG